MFCYAAYLIAENVSFSAEHIKISKKLTVATCAVCKKIWRNVPKVIILQHGGFVVTFCLWMDVVVVRTFSCVYINCSILCVVHMYIFGF